MVCVSINSLRNRWGRQTTLHSAGIPWFWLTDIDIKLVKNVFGSFHSVHMITWSREFIGFWCLDTKKWVRHKAVFVVQLLFGGYVRIGARFLSFSVTNFQINVINHVSRHFQWVHVKFLSIFSLDFLSYKVCFGFDLIAQLRVARLSSNRKQKQRRPKLAWQKLDFLHFLFQLFQKLIVFQKLEGSRIQNMCITPIFILGAWGASSWKIWLF